MGKGLWWAAAGAMGIGAIWWTAQARDRDLRQAAALRRLPPDAPRVVVLGAGFAGLSAAQTLSKRLRGRAHIQLIDRHNYHLFTPMLYQVASWGLDPYDVAFPLREFTGLHGVDFRRACVSRIDLDARRVYLDDGQVDYDYLVISLGSTTNFFGNQGAQEHACPVKWLEDGIAIRNNVIDRLERATRTTDANERRALLTFVVIGGGSTGVETAASLADFLHAVLPTDYPALDRHEVRVIVIEAAGKLLGQMDERLAKISLKHLRRMGVEVWLNAEAKDVTPGRVTTKDGRTVDTRTILWSAGVCAAPEVAQLPAAHGPGGSAKLDAYLQVEGYPGVYAPGDNGHFKDPRTGRSVPLLAQAAGQEGAAAAENLVRLIDGQPPRAFHYRSLGDVISLGRGAGVVQSAGVTVDGWAGWLAWRGIHLVRMAGVRNRLATVLDWSVGYLYKPNTARLEVEAAPQA